mmetsp:Transcript_18266/g.64710  ORF Transcript_18266/g.64710 Transcript_18266/m.64710 type:complete len:270 (+) Transcript_18266:724-1533(+)
MPDRNVTAVLSFVDIARINAISPSSVSGLPSSISDRSVSFVLSAPARLSAPASPIWLRERLRTCRLGVLRMRVAHDAAPTSVMRFMARPSVWMVPWPCSAVVMVLHMSSSMVQPSRNTRCRMVVPATASINSGRSSSVNCRPDQLGGIAFTGRRSRRFSSGSFLRTSFWISHFWMDFFGHRGSAYHPYGGYCSRRSFAAASALHPSPIVTRPQPAGRRQSAPSPMDKCVDSRWRAGDAAAIDAASGKHRPFPAPPPQLGTHNTAIVRVT